MAKIFRKSLENHKAHFPKSSVFPGQELILCHHYIQNVRDGIQIRVYKIDKERVTNFSQFCFSNGWENFEEISGSVSGKVKDKIDVLAKWRFSYVKKRVVNLKNLCNFSFQVSMTFYQQVAS